jgi:transposase InsO family protein
LKWAVTEKFKDYLHGGMCKVYTDSNPLTYVMKNAKLDATTQRWCALLANFEFGIFYKPGSLNIAADALSRSHQTQERETSDLQEWANKCAETFEQETQQETIEPNNVNRVLLVASVENNSSGNSFLDSVILRDLVKDEDTSELCNQMHVSTNDVIELFQVAGVSVGQLSKESWKKEQLQDEDVAAVYRLVQSKRIVNRRAIARMSRVSRRLLRVRRRLLIKSGVLCKQVFTGDEVLYQVVVPASLQNQMFEVFHERGVHVGGARTYDMLRSRFFWPGMKECVRKKIGSCERCQRRKSLPAVNKTELGQLREVTHPFQVISMDFVGIDFRKDAKTKVLTVVDEFTKYAFAIPVGTEQAVATAKTLFNRVFSVFGFPEVVHSDQGRSFVSKVMAESYKLAGTEVSSTTAYCPTGNATCERVNQSILNLLGTLPSDQKPRWKNYLQTLMYTYNTTIHETTKYSPFYLMFLRHPRLPIDVLLDVNDESGKELEATEYVAKLRESLLQAYRQCLENIKSSQSRHRLRYNNRLVKSIPELESGDVVLVKKQRPTSKIDDRWEEELYQVICKPKVNVPVFKVKAMKTGRVRVLHRNLILPFVAGGSVVETEKEAKVEKRVPLKAVDSWYEYCRKRGQTGTSEPVTAYSTTEKVAQVVALWKGDHSRLEIDAVINVNNPISLPDQSKSASEPKVHPGKEIVLEQRCSGEQLESALSRSLGQVEKQGCASVVIPVSSQSGDGDKMSFMVATVVCTVLRFIRESSTSGLDRIILCAESDIEFALLKQELNAQLSFESVSDGDTDEDCDMGYFQVIEPEPESEPVVDSDHGTESEDSVSGSSGVPEDILGDSPRTSPESSPVVERYPRRDRGQPGRLEYHQLGGL